ncbi:MAG: type IV pilus twitching motility protein PilT [Pyrinomonadaceae bacterium]
MSFTLEFPVLPPTNFPLPQPAKMEKLNEYLQTLISSSSYELRLEPNKNPYIVSVNGNADVANDPLPGPQISMMVYPLIPEDVRIKLPTHNEIQFDHPHNLGNFTFTVTKSPAGFIVTVRPVGVDPNAGRSSQQPSAVEVPPPTAAIDPEPTASDADLQIPVISAPDGPSVEVVDVNDPGFQTVFSETAAYEPPGRRDDLDPEGFVPPVEEYHPPQQQPPAEVFTAEPAAADRRAYADRRQKNSVMTARMDALFHLMAEIGASDLHLSVSMPPMIRKDGKIQRLECGEGTLDSEIMRELLHSIMPEKNREEFERRNDTDFAYEIDGLARFRCNVFRDRKGMGAVFRIIPAKMTTAEQLGLSSAVLGLCDLSKGLVVVTGPTGSGKSTTLCAMVNHINMQREDHIITIEDPIEFVHENIKCLVNQREVSNHTDSFKDALRAALREDPDILLVGEMRDLETISIAIETAETGHLVFGTLHTTTAASTVDRIIDQFPADRQQQIRVMLSESLKGVIAQTLLPKKGGGRVAALEILIVTPAISNLIREGKTFQIPSAMQTGKNHGMVMLNDALFDLVQKGIVEPRDAYIKAVDKASFETMLTRGGLKL